jgi:hypothetical protein
MAVYNFRVAGQKLEERLDQLKRLRNVSPDESVVAAVRKALQDRSNLIAAEAAKIAGDSRIQSLIPDLLDAFNRLFDDPVKTDPKCWGKTAIVKALTNLDYAESAPFLRGSQHVQMEPVYARTLEDTAAQLRATCVLALVQCVDLRRIEILRRVVDALKDQAESVRREAVRAIEQMNGDEAGLLLRLKAHLGDAQALVSGEVFDALLNLEREQAVVFVAGFMNSADEAIRDEATLALGASRLQGAIDLLMKTWNEGALGSFRPVVLRALSSSRQAVALDFLIDLVKEGSAADAAAALEALQLHRDSAEIQQRIRDAQKRNNE